MYVAAGTEDRAMAGPCKYVPTYLSLCKYLSKYLFLGTCWENSINIDFFQVFAWLKVKFFHGLDVEMTEFQCLQRFPLLQNWIYVSWFCQCNIR